MEIRGRARGIALSLLVLSLTLVDLQPAHAADAFLWTTPSSANSVGTRHSAISADGSVILIGKNGSSAASGVYLSTNGGTSFSKIAGITAASYTVAVSADGTKMFAVALDSNNLYYSTDTGATWTQKTSAVSTLDNYATCMSGDGSVWMSGGSTGVYVSTDFGVTWTAQSGIGTGTWWSCWMNSSGSIRYVLPWNAALKISSNSGSSWTTSGTAVYDAYCLTSSSDGTKIYIGSRNGYNMYKSTNSGSSFTLLKNFGYTVVSCAASANGNTVIAAVSSRYLQLSTDGGSTWSDEVGSTMNTWNTVSMSSDATKAFATTFASGNSYVGSIPQPLSFSLSSGRAELITYRTSNTLTTTSNYAGKVTFFANGKKIGGCVSVPTNGSFVATCNYKPTIHGAVTITARFVPSDSYFSTILQELFRTSVVKRTNTR
jgi:hypothetical protein